MENLTCPVCGNIVGETEEAYASCSRCGAEFVVGEDGDFVLGADGELLSRSAFAADNEDEMSTARTARPAVRRRQGSVAGR
jgi:hypothetical protein